MKRMATGFCVAAALGVATLGAQTPSTTTQRTDAAKEITLTGCLSKGADGKYMLTNAKADNPSTATAGTSGTTTPPTGTTSGSAGAMNTAASWTLSGTDLDKHVGHQIQVTGKAAMNPAMDHKMPDTTAAAAGSAAAGSAAAGTVGTSGSTATATEEQRKDTKDAAPRLDVSSVKMIAATCSQ